MNPSPELGPIEPPNYSLPGAPLGDLPLNWRQAIMELIANRFAMIQLESKGVFGRIARRGIFLGLSVGCLVATWILVLAGGIAWIAEANNWHWSRVALVTALVHFLLGVLFARKATGPASPTFPATRNEFQKDREWIENFHTTKKSND